ncbi:MAG: alpha/beta hydrolase, partial [Tannerellaceae bacterium]|nr:alpha/beta hydrolase [Tannerellaceae bacterium]
RGEARRDIFGVPEERSAGDTENTREFIDYYRTPRGMHPRATTAYSFTSMAPMMNFFPFAQIETISSRPLLFIVGERAVSAYFSEDAYSKAAEPKELFVVPGASHVDLYDRPEYMDISLPKLDHFFQHYLR